MVGFTNNKLTQYNPNPQHFFVTGATGLLGSHTIRSILLKYPTSTIYTIVKYHVVPDVEVLSDGNVIISNQGDMEMRQTHITDTFFKSISKTQFYNTKHYNNPNSPKTLEDFNKRVKVLYGDLSLPRFGMEKSTWDFLSTNGRWKSAI